MAIMCVFAMIIAILIGVICASLLLFMMGGYITAFAVAAAMGAALIVLGISGAKLSHDLDSIIAKNLIKTVFFPAIAAGFLLSVPSAIFLATNLI